MQNLTPWLTLGPGWLFTAIAVVMLFTGGLHTHRAVNRLLEDRDNRIRELILDRDTWKEAYERSERNYQPLAEYAATSNELAQTAVDIILALQDGRG